jgi:hypothetical protein
MTTFAVSAHAQLNQQGQNELTTPLDPVRPGVTAVQIFDELLAHNALRAATLVNYTAFRTYQVVDLKGKVHAEEIGQMEYRAPDQKKFAVTSEKGSALVRCLALHALIASEIETAAGKQHHDSAISPANYTLDLLGEQLVGPYHCFVVQAIPKRRDKYLFEGKVWIDAEDYAVVRIEGHPAKKLSFWIQRANFVRQYQKIDQFLASAKRHDLCGRSALWQEGFDDRSSRLQREFVGRYRCVRRENAKFLRFVLS